MSVYIIAEAGINHNGNFEIACKLVDAAKDAGADCVKFQTFVSEKLVSKYAMKAEYQKSNTGEGTQIEMLKSLELSYNDFLNLKSYCDKVGIVFLSTPFDVESIEFLDKISMPFWKIPSGEITNYPYLVSIAKTQKPIVMSTGMSDLCEVKDALNTLISNGASDIKLLHCNTEYPTPFEDVNLCAIQTLRDEFECEVGYSDHTTGIEVALAAVAMGAVVIEKHFTLDRKMEGPDHKASLEPNELKEMVRSIRNIEKAMGNGKKHPSPSEMKNIEVARKSIVAKRKIFKGEELSSENICTKRPGTGINPMRWNEVIGTKAIKNFNEDEQIEL